MKLLYLYVKEYGCIIDKEFNFDSNLRFYLDKERRVLIDEEKKILPDDFFEILHYPSDNPVSSVTAIIGKNGSGKTSLARCIGDVVNDFNKSISKVIFSDNEEQKIQYIAILEFVNNKLGMISTLEEKIKYRGKTLNIIDKKFLKDLAVEKELPVDIIYYSPFFTTEYVKNNNITVDLSTSKLLSDVILPSVNNSNPTNVSIHLGLKQHELSEYKQTLIFLNNYFNHVHLEPNFKNQLDLPIPKGLIVEIDEISISTMFDNLKELIKKYSVKEDFTRLNEKLNRARKEKRTKDFLITAFLYCIACCYYDFVTSYYFVYKRRGKEVKQQKDKIEKQINEISKNIKFLESNISKLSHNEISIDDFHKKIFHYLEKQKYLSNNKKVLSFFLLINEIYNKNRKHNDKLIIDFTDYSKEKVLDFVNKYYSTILISDYLKFDFNPKMSSGEMVFVSMYSRIYDYLNNSKSHKNIILILDEAETTLHPEWQRKLVNQMILFLDILGRDHKVHLMFASHSPILLSDIPKGNVVFLENNQDEEQKTYENDIHETFASNIYSLYRYSFFLEGTVGEFAYRKIKCIYDYLKDIIKNRTEFDTSSKESIKLMILLIGEPIIKDQLLKLYNKAFSDPTPLIEYYEEKLNILKNNK